jgi:hypothetical protein
MKCYFSFKAKCDELNGIKPVKSNTCSNNHSKPDQVEEKETAVQDLPQDDVIKSRFFSLKNFNRYFSNISHYSFYKEPIR